MVPWSSLEDAKQDEEATKAFEKERREKDRRKVEVQRSTKRRFNYTPITSFPPYLFGSTMRTL